jgi:hypothetical protein
MKALVRQVTGDGIESGPDAYHTAGFFASSSGWNLCFDSIPIADDSNGAGLKGTIAGGPIMATANTVQSRIFFEHGLPANGIVIRA